MRKILSFVILGILILSGFGAGAVNSDNDINEIEKIDNRPIDNLGKGYTHTILGEFGTATWCGFCKYAHGALKNIYEGGWHPFYYVTLVCDVNTHADDRKDELGLTGYPTVYFDDDYIKNVGAGSIPAAQAAYNSSIVSCGNRNVKDIDLTLDVTWLGPGNPNPENLATDESIECNLTWTNSEMNIDVTIDNNEVSKYNCHLHTYVTEVESSLGWYDTAGELYTFPFLDYAFNEDVTISSGGSWQDDINWDGKDYNNGYGTDFGGITQDNIMVIATVFDEDNNDYSDETAGFLAGTNTDPKTFDVYLGETNPPPLVSSNQSELYYEPDEYLEFDTTYYWKIVVWDNQGASQTGPIWSFTTRGNDPPADPSDPDPYDGETDVFINTDVSWNCSDPDGDDVTYDVYFGTSSPPPKILSNHTKTSYKPSELLNFDTDYYWQIVAWDVYDYSAVGTIWSFTTEENAPPYEASEPDPEDGETNVDVDQIIRWTGDDPNPGDRLTYDVYFGTSSPPPLVDEGVVQEGYDPGTMDLATTYYWQIVSEDSGGLTSTGPIWEFTTQLEPNDPPNEPNINGPHTGKPGKEICWTFAATDPDGDDLKYVIQWGDGETITTDCFPSGQSVEECHTYSEEGTFYIRAKAVECDSGDLESDWSEHKVTIPRGKLSLYTIFLRLLERYPISFPILRNLLGL